MQVTVSARLYLQVINPIVFDAYQPDNIFSYPPGDFSTLSTWCSVHTYWKVINMVIVEGYNLVIFMWCYLNVINLVVFAGYQPGDDPG